MSVVQRFAGTLRVLVCWQGGGGLLILGTATLTNTNLYANQATNYVCLPPELSLNSPSASLAARKFDP